MCDDDATVDSIVVPGGRDVRASLDRAGGDGAAGATQVPSPGPSAAAGDDAADACVVACPPHPQHRGHRGDGRLRAVSDRVGDAGVDCLRFDYGDWDEGYGELADAYSAVDWASARYDRVALFGFSFGGCVSLLAAGGRSPTGGTRSPVAVDAVSALAPAARLAEELDAVAAMDRVDVPAQVVYGSRDDTADWEPVVDRARDLDWAVRELSADHFFVGQRETVGDAVGSFLAAQLGVE